MSISATVMPGLGRVYLPASEAPSQDHPLHVARFPYEALMGPWCVVASSLPLWRKRKNISIAYEPVALPPAREPLAASSSSQAEEAPGTEPLDDEDLQEYLSVSFADECRWQEDPRPPNPDKGDDPTVAHPDDPDQPPSATKSWIRGVNRLQAQAPNGTCMAWRGKSWMMLLTASWEIIGLSTPFIAHCHADGSQTKDKEQESQPEWLITYFGASYFTPSGIDVYVRNAHDLKPEQYAAIVQALTSLKENSSLDAAQRAKAEEIARLASELYRIPHDRP